MPSPPHRPPATPVSGALVRRVSCVLLVCGLLGLTACGGSPEAPISVPMLTTEDPEAEQALRNARRTSEAESDESAIEAYRGFIRDFPNDPMVAVAQIELGRLHLAAGQHPEAKSLFESLLAHEDQGIRERATFYLGVAEHLLGEHARALTLLRPLVGRTVDPEESALLLRTVAAAADAVGDVEASLVALDSLIQSAVPEAERRRALNRIPEVVNNTASTDEILGLYQTLSRRGHAWQHVARRAARISFEAGDMQRVIQIADAMTDRGVDLDEETRSLALRARRTSEASSRTIGAILPLEGRGAEVGRYAMRGIMLASHTPSRQPIAEGQLQVVFRNDAGDPEAAVQAVDDLVTLHRVMAIIGPVGTRSARAAAQRAQELGVPLIALAPGGRLETIGPMSFRYYATPHTEARSILTTAMNRGIRRAAVLAPATPFGEAMTRAFVQEAASLGVEITARETYPAGTTAFGATVSRLAESTWDAVFVPDSWRTLSSIAPAFAAANIWSAAAGSSADESRRTFTLLAPGVAYDPELVRRAGRYLQGAIFTLAFNAESTDPAVQTFVSDYQNRFGESPDTHAAYAYDVFRIIGQALPRTNQSRSQLAALLTSQPAARGALTLGGTFDSSRNAVTLPQTWVLSGERLIPTLSPAGAPLPSEPSP